MPAKKPSQGQETIRPSRDASTAGAQGHVSSDNVSGRRAGWNDDKKNPMREGTFTTDAEKDQSELFKDELRNQLNNRERHPQQLEKERVRKEEREKRRLEEQRMSDLERRLQQLEVERVRNEKEQENRRLEEQRVRMQLEYEEEKKKIKAREEELNNRERHLEEQRVSMQLEYEEAQKKIKAREAEVLKRQADEMKKEAEQKRREADDEKLRKQQEQKEQENRRLEEQRVRMQLEYEEEKKKIKAREEELNNRERHLQQLEKERVRKEEREKRRLEEQRVSMQLEYEEAQKKIKAREAEVLKRQADEMKKEAEQKRREADDEKLRKHQEQIERKRREREQGLKPYTASSEGASWNPAGNLHSRESTEKQDYHNEKPEWLKLQSTRSVQGNPDKVFTVQWKSTHNVSIPSDSDICSFTAICVLPDGKVLVADHSNKKVKLLDQQYQVFSHCGVTNRVLDMCLITPSEVAVAVYGDSKKHEVQFITVTQSKLVSGRKFRLQHECSGIAHYQGDLFICSGEALFKYTLSGKQVCRLYENQSDELTGMAHSWLHTQTQHYGAHLVYM
ncbi:golgin subfamily A member 6-like protein 1 [Dreissena polymorpha]|uniref:golgin subfamily A member 6-like protein 1 n=1 Tax=Dreissena polymorpha TaxID=45954 RepID=UPI002264241B|nr:golgin subfamily A member 6-like protein 1 [Dreissena polymorpha]